MSCWGTWTSFPQQVLKVEGAHSSSFPFLALCAELESWLPDVLKRDKILVNKGLVDFLEDVHPFCNLPEHRMDPVQVVQVFSSCNEELKSKQHNIKSGTVTWPPHGWQLSPSFLVHLRPVLTISVVHHGHCPLLPVLDARHLLCIKEASLVSVKFAKKKSTGVKTSQFAQLFYEEGKEKAVVRKTDQ